MVANFPRNKRRLRQAIYCGHCKRNVPHATFYRHRDKYYNVENESWVPLAVCGDDDSSLSGAESTSPDGAQETSDQQEREG